MNQPLKVAVIGASGIGKNHARWFHRHGCDVAAFVVIWAVLWFAWEVLGWSPLTRK